MKGARRRALAIARCHDIRREWSGTAVWLDSPFFGRGRCSGCRCSGAVLTTLAEAIVKQCGDLPDSERFIGAVGLNPHRCADRCSQQHHRNNIARAYAPPPAHQEQIAATAFRYVHNFSACFCVQPARVGNDELLHLHWLFSPVTDWVRSDAKRYQSGLNPLARRVHPSVLQPLPIKPENGAGQHIAKTESITGRSSTPRDYHTFL